MPEFDANLSPLNVHNIEIARLLNLNYDSLSGVYRNDDGCPVRDKYGQNIG